MTQDDAPQPPARVRADPECPRCQGRGYVVDTSRGGLSLALCLCVVRVTEVPAPPA